VQRSGRHPLRVGDEVSLHCTIPAFAAQARERRLLLCPFVRAFCAGIPAGTAGSRGFQSRSNASLHHTGCFCGGNVPARDKTLALSTELRRQPQRSCRARESNPRYAGTGACSTPQTQNTTLSLAAACSFPSASTPVAFAREFASVHQLANSPRTPAGHGAPAHFSRPCRPALWRCQPWPWILPRGISPFRNNFL